MFSGGEPNNGAGQISESQLMKTNEIYAGSAVDCSRRKLIRPWQQDRRCPIADARTLKTENIVEF